MTETHCDLITIAPLWNRIGVISKWVYFTWMRFAQSYRHYCKMPLCSKLFSKLLTSVEKKHFQISFWRWNVCASEKSPINFHGRQGLTAQKKKTKNKYGLSNVRVSPKHEHSVYYPPLNIQLWGIFSLGVWKAESTNSQGPYSWALALPLGIRHCYQMPNTTKTLEFGAERSLLQGHARRHVACAQKTPELPEGF